MAATKATPGKIYKDILAEILQIKTLLNGRGAIKERNAIIMAHVMFGVYAALWVSTCSKKIDSLRGEHLHYVWDNLYSLPRVYLAALTFVSLVCLWWWYTNVFLATNVFQIVGMSSWELLLLAAFALAYDTWGKDYVVFGVIFFIGMMLLAVKFGLTIIVLCRKRKTATAEFKTLVCGATATLFVLAGFCGAAVAAKYNSPDGSFQDHLIPWYLVLLVLFCILATLASVIMLKYQQRQNSDLA